MSKYVLVYLLIVNPGFVRTFRVNVPDKNFKHGYYCKSSVRCLPNEAFLPQISFGRVVLSHGDRFCFVLKLCPARWKIIPERRKNDYL